MFKKSFIIFALIFTISMPAQSGMRFTAIMVTQEEFEKYKGNEEALLKELFEPKPGVALDLDKAWHGIHYILTGTPWSADGTLGQAILGGKEFGSNLGYGPARYLTKQQVADIAAELNNFTIERFKGKYDATRMMKVGIYPPVWDTEGDEGLKWLISGFRDMTEFYNNAARSGKGVILVTL